MRRAALPIPSDIGRIERRFWSRVDRRGPDECWEWRGARSRQGYGNIAYGYKCYLASRVALHFDGRTPLPHELVCHTCDNPPCCNPSHLFKGSVKDNAADSIAKGRARPPIRRFGEAHTQAKLTEAFVAQIKARLASGERQAHLAREFGVSPACIRKIQYGQSWTHPSEGGGQ